MYKYLDVIAEKIVSGVDMRIRKLEGKEMEGIQSSSDYCYLIGEKDNGYYSHSDKNVLIDFARELWNIRVPVNVNVQFNHGEEYPHDVKSGINAIAHLYNSQALRFHHLIGKPDNTTSHIGVIGYVKWITEERAEEVVKVVASKGTGRFSVL